ncbi:MAG: CBS domain-containing protein [Elusimicrobiota bacterium]
MASDPFLEPISRLGRLDFLQAEESLSYRDSLELMRERGLGSILVCRGGRLTGIFTERDILNKLVLEAPPANTPVREFMTRPVVTAGEGATVGDAVRLMHGKHIRNLPIVDAEGKPKGLVTVGRIIRLLAAHYPAEVVNLPPKPGQVTEEVEGA